MKKKLKKNLCKIIAWALMIIGWITAFILCRLESTKVIAAFEYCSFFVSLSGLILIMIKTKMNSIFKIIFCLILFLTAFSWAIPASYFGGADMIDVGLYRIGVDKILQYPFTTFMYFANVLFFVLVVVAFYSILGKTGKYRTVLEKFAAKLKGKEKLFLILTTVLFATLTAVFGYGILLFLFIPFIVSIMLLLGYNRITGFLATFGAILVGQIGSIYNQNIISYINTALSQTYSDLIYVRIGVFVIVTTVLVLFVIKYSSKQRKAIKEEAQEDFLLGEKKTTKTKSYHIIVVLSILFVALVFGCTQWSSIFGITLFDNLQVAINGFVLKFMGQETTFFVNFLGGLGALGTWTISNITSCVILASIVVIIVYKIKVDEALDAAFDGVVKMLKPALLAVFAYTILIIVAYHPFFTTIGTWIIDLTSTFNVFTAVIDTILSSAFNIDMNYVAQCNLPYMAVIFESGSAYTPLALITQTMYGLTMLIAPTSTILIIGLGYNNISYGSWIKNSWKFIVSLFVILLIMIFIVSLI